MGTTGFDAMPSGMPSAALAQLLSGLGAMALLVALGALILALARLAWAGQLGRPLAVAELLGAVALCLAAAVVVAGMPAIVDHLVNLARSIP
jgi:hypothetical protein